MFRHLRLLLILGSAASGSLVSAQSVTVMVQPTSMVLTSTGTPGKYQSSSKGATVTVVSGVPSWTLYCQADAVTTPSGTLNGKNINMIKVPNVNPLPGVTWLPNPVKLDPMVQIATGGVCRGIVGSFKLSVDINALTKPGTLGTNLRFWLKIGNGGLKQMVVFPISFQVAAYVAVSLGGTAMTFTSAQPGNKVSNQVLPLTVTTNAPAGATVTLLLSQLISGLGSIPKNRTALKWATTAALALSGAATAPLGQGTGTPFLPYSISSAYGAKTYYVAGRVVTTLTDKPGTYIGLLTVTGSVN